MADSSTDELVFRGSSPEECETFVSTIRKRALAEKKHRDNEWIAYLASSCFVGDAFYWYEDLDRETQDDWSRLRPALVARFGRTRQSHGSNSTISVPRVSVPPATIPAPAAAAPPPAPNSITLTRKGRLKVLGPDGKLRGYISETIENPGLYRAIVESPKCALSVSLPPPSSSRFFEITVSSPVSTTSDVIGVAWPNLSGMQWMESMGYNAACCSWSSVKAQSTWATERNVWAISDDAELSATYPKPDGGYEPLRAYIFSNLLLWRRTSGTEYDTAVGERHYTQGGIKLISSVSIVEGCL